MSATTVLLRPHGRNAAAAFPASAAAGGAPDSTVVPGASEPSVMPRAAAEARGPVTAASAGESGLARFSAPAPFPPAGTPQAVAVPTDGARRGASPTGSAATDLVLVAERTIVEASVVATAAERYALAHLAALRAAAAVLAARGRPRSKRGRQVASAWAILPVVAPELAEWAAFFAAGARKRQSAEAGIACVTHREADDLVRESQAFLQRVCEVIGIVHQPTIEPALRSVG